MQKNLLILILLTLSILGAFAFIFIFDVSGECAGEHSNSIPSGTDRALSVDIRLENWTERLPPPALLTWDEPLYRRRVRERAPQAFPPDREAQVHANVREPSGTAGGALLTLHFQYKGGDFTPAEAGDILSRLAAAYTEELAAGGVTALPAGGQSAREADLRALFLTLIVIKSAMAAFAALFLITLILACARWHIGYKKIFAVTICVFLTGSIGLALANTELLSTSEFARYLQPSVLIGQKISVTQPEGSGQDGEYDWRIMPQSARFALSLLRKEEPSVTEEKAQIYLAYFNPIEIRLMRGEDLAREAGWHLTLSVMTDFIGERDEARDTWLAGEFWKVKTEYESFLAADRLSLVSEGEAYTIEDYPPRRAHTRARTLAAYLIASLGFSFWVWRILRKPKKQAGAGIG